MKVWGVGALWKTENKSGFFIDNECIKIGYKKDVAPDLYEMMGDINVNDFVYIKSFVPKSRMLHIKAIGIVNMVSKNSGEISVHWFADMRQSPLKISLNNFNGKNNVYSNTLYREYNNEIIQYIFNNVKIN